MKFQTKLYLFFALTVILPICIATAVVAVLFSRISTDEANDRLLNSASVARAYIQTTSIILTNDLASKLAGQTSLAEALTARDPAAGAQALDTILKETGASQVTLYASDGSLLAQSGTGDLSGHCLAATSIPVMQSGAVIGTVKAARDINDAYLADILNETGLATSVSCDATVKGSTFPGAALPPKVVPEPGQVSAVGTAGGEDYFLYEYPVSLQPSVQPVVFTFGYPAGVVSDRRTIVLETGGLLIGFTVIIAGLLGFLTTRTITNPLRLLTQAVLKAEAGDLSCRVEISSRDEVGVLARNFNRMCGQISRFIQQMREAQRRLLQAFGYAGDMLVSSYDREKLAQSVTDTVALATESRATAFYISEDGDGGPRLVPVSLWPEGFFDVTRTRMIEEALRGVENGSVKGMAASQLDNDLVYMISPISLQENTFGALAVVVDAERARDESSFRILQSLANQAATAMENIRLNERLQEMVITDSLTGLFNVRHFHDSLASQIEISRRYEHNLSLLVIDLDDFKKVNDTYGHPVGDEVLRQVGSLLVENIRKTDIAARYGGEEFAIILPHTSKDTAVSVAEKLRVEAQARRIEDYPDIRISFSIGVAAFPDDAGSPGKLMREADEATYKAKRAGKNRTEVA